ncbi:UDP-N-acetylenolpyruvoylglucosamine reductase [Kosmotoga arenicorallina S304]|uniref:UDP-N-acetylenolpyruvoylglucosamine reductase n=1 Tax=Kosmotoga arenicorallina S304 TaxID=1453497 RepID=A0A176K0P8_9BACT|nr:UDP-N-acetylmuramate dehydrogenase [Kosmotoga arenicorallina]OAA30074.1 UDP-N-acetylenolpyruvoylglucosamine reductase [Kosmotoga arenicorallina S304]
MDTELFEKLYLAGCQILPDVKLSEYTTIRIGGPARAVIFPQNLDAFIDTLSILAEKNEHYKILGGGSNVVPPDEYKGIVVSTRALTGAKFSGNRAVVDCGLGIQRLIRLAASHGLSGLEFLSGLPGSLGGALFMNAGAFGGEIGDLVEEVAVLDDGFNIKLLKAEEIEFSYRSSSLSNYVILNATLKFSYAQPEKVLKEMEHILKRRLEKQPLDQPSAGSTFKRPRKDFYVGTTIDALGLKGLRVGGAEISRKHAGFIVNRGKATQEDVVRLIERVREIVYSTYNVKLETEVEIWKGGSYA